MPKPLKLYACLLVAQGNLYDMERNIKESLEYIDALKHLEPSH